MSYNLTTGLANHRCHYAQLGDVGLVCNGHDLNGIVDLRTGTYKTLGMAAPGAAPTQSNAGTGITGSFLYRVRWKDTSTGTYSLASATLSISVVNKTVTITRPGSPPSRADFWVLERTTDGGAFYYPVNVNSSNVNGTAIATTTYADSVQDSTLRNRIAYPDNQGQPNRYRFCWANGAILFMGGGRIHRPTCTLTNGATTCTSTAGSWLSDHVGEDISADADTDGVTYKISAFVNANSVTLASNYSGTTGTKACSQAGPRDFIAWCDPGDAESWGQALIGTLQNVLRIGDDGEAVTSGVGMGPAGVLIAKSLRLYQLSYQFKPNMAPYGDGRLVPLQSRRGAVGFHAMKNIEGRIYGMDTLGVWRLSPGGEPEEIGGPLLNDWRDLDFTNSDNWLIAHDPLFRWLYFYVAEASTDTYPKRAYIWDLEREQWVNSKNYAWAGVTCAVNLPDLNQAIRLVYANEVVGSAKSYFWFDNIGPSLGADPNSTLLSSTATSGSATTIGKTGAAWTTSGEGLAGIPVTLVRAADSSEETRIIVSNTATLLTTTAFTGGAPVSGDTYHIGVINSMWRTGRIAPDPKEKVYFRRLYVWTLYDANAINFRVRTYVDGSTTAFSDYTIAINEDGVTTTVSGTLVTVAPSTQKYVFEVPLGMIGRDVQLEFSSLQPGKPWQILECQLEYDLDTSQDPGKK